MCQWYSLYIDCHTGLQPGQVENSHFLPGIKYFPPGFSCGLTIYIRKSTPMSSLSFSIPSTTLSSTSPLVWLSWWRLRGDPAGDILIIVRPHCPVPCARYNAVCRPHYFHYRTVVSHSLTNLTSYVLPVVILSTLLNIPKFFETEFVSFKLYFCWSTEAGKDLRIDVVVYPKVIVSMPLEDPANSSDSINVTTYMFTDLRNDPHYIK